MTNSGGGGHNPNNMNNDPYANRDNYAQNDVYAKKNPYAQGNVWKRDDPYDNPNEKGAQENSNKLCNFWFDSKLKMQNIYSSDVGSQAEGRVFNTDTDPFIIQLFVKFSMYGMSNLFTAPLVVIGLFLASLYATLEFKFIIIVVELLYVGLILYCPAWQTYTAGQYAVSSTGEDFYQKWLKGYKGYEGSTIFGYTVGVIIIATLAEYRFPFDYIYNFLMIDMPSDRVFMNSVWFVVISNTILLILYYALVAKLKKIDNEKKKVNKRINIDSRTMSIVGQLGAYMDRTE